MLKALLTANALTSGALKLNYQRQKSESNFKMVGCGAGAVVAASTLLNLTGGCRRTTGSVAAREATPKEISGMEHGIEVI